MSLSSLFFIFVFLPLSLVTYYVSPNKIKLTVLSVLSLLFFSWGTPKYILLMLFSILFNYVGGLEINRLKVLEKSNFRIKSTVTFVVLINVLFLCFFKYLGFLFDNINLIFGTGFKDSGLAAPLGISFFTFQVLSYIFDVYRDKAPVEKNLINFSCYVLFFPKLTQGPITDWNLFRPQMYSEENKKFKLTNIGEGMGMLVVGLGKKLIIADNLAIAFGAMQKFDRLSFIGGWLQITFYILDLYMDFSSYSDMAIGIGKMFGFELTKNFDYPYTSTSVSEFWRRWHISLGAWFRNYVYIPLGGNRVSKAKYIRNIFIVWMLTGFWHGADWNFILWGFLYGVLLLIERFLIGDFLKKTSKIISITYTMFFTMLGFVLFSSPNMIKAGKWMGNMFFIGANGFIDSNAKYYLVTYLPLLIIAIIGSTPLVKKLAEKIKGYGTLGSIAINVSYVIIFILSMAYMIGSTYTSFLYQQF